MEPDQFQMEPECDRPTDEDESSWWQCLDDEARAWEAAHSGSELVSIPNRSPSVDNSVDNL